MGAATEVGWPPPHRPLFMFRTRARGLVYYPNCAAARAAGAAPVYAGEPGYRAS